MGPKIWGNFFEGLFKGLFKGANKNVLYSLSVKNDGLRPYEGFI